MDDKPDSQPKRPVKNTTGMWKLWLAVAIAIVYIILAQMEAHSPEADARRNQAVRNAVDYIYSDTYSSCTGANTEEECRQEAKDAADFARQKMAPLVGK